MPGFEPALPRFLGGISLGGCITFNAMLAQKAEAAQLFKWVATQHSQLAAAGRALV